jgi:hypothetical protein
MPILINNNFAFVVTRSEFLKEYAVIQEKFKKQDVKEKNILDTIVDNFKGLNFTYSAIAIYKLYEKAKEEHKNDFNKRLFCFNFYEEEAQAIAIELLVLFSEFYHRIKILDAEDNLINIREYLLPYKKFYLFETSKITICDGKLQYSFFLGSIRQVKGLINNFSLFLDNQLLHFCHDAHAGYFMKITPRKYSFDGANYYEISDYDYVFERNKPNRFKLIKYRKKGLLVLLQFENR